MCTNASSATEPVSGVGQNGAGLLTVIVPVYNVAPYIENCLRSLLAQTYAPLEIVAVNDGSTDGSYELVQRMAAGDARIKLLTQQNAGLSAARNAGLDAANGTWIGFVDGDDAVEPDMYARLIGEAVRHGADIASGCFLYVFPDRTQALGGSGRVTVYTQREAMEALPLEKALRFEVCPKVFRREAIGDSRFRPGQIYEDIRFTRLTFFRANLVVAVDSSLYRYLQNRAGSTNTRFPPEKLETVAEVDAFAAALDEAGYALAAERMRAFCLEFLIRLTVNARACKAGRDTEAKLLGMYRRRLRAGGYGRGVRHGRAALFALSPALYDAVSRLLHKRA